MSVDGAERDPARPPRHDEEQAGRVFSINAGLRRILDARRWTAGRWCSRARPGQSSPCNNRSPQVVQDRHPGLLAGRPERLRSGRMVRKGISETAMFAQYRWHARPV